MMRRYAAILGNLGRTKDRFCDAYKDNPTTMDMLKAAAKISYISGIELVGTWDINTENVREMKMALVDYGLKCVSIIPDLFANRMYSKGSFSSTDPRIRRHAIDYVKTMCDVAEDLACPIINLWPGQDGYDYLLAADYERELAWMAEAVYELACAHPMIQFSMEFKPKEPRTHSYLARTGDTLLFTNQLGLPNVGITIDTGHAFVGGDTLAEAVVLAMRYGNRLFHMHFNDNHITTDDDMIVGSVHTIAYIEALYWLDRCGYSGWLSMDQYPYREDAASAIEESIFWLTHFSRLLDRYRSDIDTLIAQQNPVATSRFLRQMLGAETLVS